MRLQRFFLDQQPSGKQFSVADSALIHQWKNVFRFSIGDSVIIFVGDGNEYVARLTVLEKKQATLLVEKKQPALVQNNSLALFPALIKKDNLEWVFQKATELGVTRFTPILSERSEKKSLNADRARKIVVEAAEQSGWGTIPLIGGLSTLTQVLGGERNLAAFDASGETFSDDTAKGLRDGGGVLTGPEGGFSPDELALFRKRNIPVFSLGKQTLRAETAAVVIAAKILL